MNSQGVAPLSPGAPNNQLPTRNEENPQIRNVDNAGQKALAKARTLTWLPWEFPQRKCSRSSDPPLKEVKAPFFEFYSKAVKPADRLLLRDSIANPSHYAPNFFSANCLTSQVEFALNENDEKLYDSFTLMVLHLLQNEQIPIHLFNQIYLRMLEISAKKARLPFTFCKILSQIATTAEDQLRLKVELKQTQYDQLINPENKLPTIFTLLLSPYFNFSHCAEASFKQFLTQFAALIAVPHPPIEPQLADLFLTLLDNTVKRDRGKVASLKNFIPQVLCSSTNSEVITRLHGLALDWADHGLLNDAGRKGIPEIYTLIADCLHRDDLSYSKRLFELGQLPCEGQEFLIKLKRGLDQSILPKHHQCLLTTAIELQLMLDFEQKELWELAFSSLKTLSEQYGGVFLHYAQYVENRFGKFPPTQQRQILELYASLLVTLHERKHWALVPNLEFFSLVFSKHIRVPLFPLDARVKFMEKMVYLFGTNSLSKALPDQKIEVLWESFVYPLLSLPSFIDPIFNVLTTPPRGTFVTILTLRKLLLLGGIVSSPFFPFAWDRIQFLVTLGCKLILVDQRGLNNLLNFLFKVANQHPQLTLNTDAQVQLRSLCLSQLSSGNLLATFLFTYYLEEGHMTQDAYPRFEEASKQLASPPEWTLFLRCIKRSLTTQRTAGIEPILRKWDYYLEKFLATAANHTLQPELYDLFFQVTIHLRENFGHSPNPGHIAVFFECYQISSTKDVEQQTLFERNKNAFKALVTHQIMQISSILN